MAVNNFVQQHPDALAQDMLQVVVRTFVAVCGQAPDD
jgi:hypothetical protein